MPSGEPFAWKPKLLGVSGVTWAFQDAAGVKVTAPVVPVLVPFQALTIDVPAGRFTVTRQLPMVVVDLIVT